MDPLIKQILAILIESPGNVIYSLVVVISVMMALQAAILQAPDQANSTRRRLIGGLAGIIGAQLLVFLASALGWQHILDPQWILPVLDRSVIFLSLVIIYWLWAFPQQNKRADRICIGAGLLAVAYGVGGLIYWNQLAGVLHFNGTPLDVAWAAGVLALAMAGILTLILRKPRQWNIGFGVFFIIAFGASAHLLWAEPSNDSAAILRLAQICVYPLLPILAAPTHTARAQALLRPASQEPISTPARKFYVANPLLVSTWLKILKIQDPQKYGPAIMEGIARSMIADMAFLITSSDPRSPIVLSSGFDLIREETISGVLLDQDQAPQISSALQRKKPLSLAVDANAIPADLTALTRVLGLKEAGPLMFIPLNITTFAFSGILVLSPYSKHRWNEDDQTFLQSVSANISELFSNTIVRINLNLENEKLAGEIQDLKNELTSAYTQQDALHKEFARQRELQNGNQPAEFNGLRAIQREAQEVVSRLEAENASLREALQDFNAQGVTFHSSKELSHLETELRKSLEEIAQLQNALADANIKIIQLQQGRKNSPIPSNQADLTSAIAQELRQPISSILGYTDLLMSESVGILGALQKKFLERIKAATERMRTLLDELLQLSSTAITGIDIAPQPVDLETILDQAITDISDVMKEKNINLHMDIPDEMPNLYADRDSLHQIIIHLLQNASAATPQEGNVGLQVRIKQNDPDEAFMLLQVTDDGGGIPQKDIPRVFASQYRDEHAPISGVGDNGVGLSITKTLVEAHGGRIWIETEAEKTTTFSILLPISPSRVNGNHPQK